MRVLVYVPAQVRGAARLRREAEGEARRRGHHVVGSTDSPAQVHAALQSGVADRIGVVRDAHLRDLVQWAEVLEQPSSRGAAAAGWLAPVAWIGWVRDRVVQHPRVAAAVTAVAAAAVGLVLLPDSQSGRQDMPDPPVAGPPAGAAPDTPGPLPTRAPATPTSQPAQPPPPPSASTEAPPAAPGDGGGAEMPPEPPPPTAGPGDSPPPPVPPEPEPEPSATSLPPGMSPSPTPPGPPEGQAACVLRVELLGVRLEVCLPLSG